MLKTYTYIQGWNKETDDRNIFVKYLIKDPIVTANIYDEHQHELPIFVHLFYKVIKQLFNLYFRTIVQKILPSVTETPSCSIARGRWPRGNRTLGGF